MRTSRTPEVEPFGRQMRSEADQTNNKTGVISMRTIVLVGSLSLILNNGTAGAQSGPPPKSATSSTTAQIPRALNNPTKADRLSPSDQERIAQYTAQCLNDWDAATHMTKPEWARVCKRVVDGRAKFMLETGFRLPDPR